MTPQEQAHQDELEHYITCCICYRRFDDVAGPLRCDEGIRLSSLCKFYNSAEDMRWPPFLA